MRKLLFILFFTMCGNILLQAQDDIETGSDTVGAEVKIFEENANDYYEEERDFNTDTNLIARTIAIAEDSIAVFKNQKDFSYIHHLDSLLKASQKSEAAAPVEKAYKGDSFMSRLLSGSAIKFILWGLALVFVGIIVYQLLISKGIFQRSSASKVAVQQVEDDELLLQNNFDQLLQQAFNAGDYRLAVRYHFLKVLQQLSHHNLISYEPDKTNSRYVYELPVNHRNEFSQLILQYEYVWYGHFDITAEQYGQVQKGFHSFLQKV